MKRKDIKIGALYSAKVSGNLVKVRILYENSEKYNMRDAVVRHGGWTAINEATGRNIQIRTAARLRYEIL